MLHGPEAVIPLPNLPSAQLRALSGQLALQAAAAAGGGGGDIPQQGGGNINTANNITNNNTEVYKSEPGLRESTLEKINISRVA